MKNKNLQLALVFILAASCGGNGKNGGDAGDGTDGPGDLLEDGSDLPPDLPPDVPPDSIPDAPLDDTPFEPPPPGETIYVDTQIAEPSCTTYDEASRSCGGGALTAYRDLNEASGAAEPGDLVIVRGATLTERFIPQRSGEEGAPITFQGYPGETVTITLPDGPFLPGFEFTAVHDLVVDGIHVNDAMMWAQILDSTRNVFRNCRFTVARDEGSRGGFRLVNSDANQIIGCTFEDGNDNLFLENSNRNVITESTLRMARHTLLVLACSSYNVVRENTFHNDLQKGGETFDCEGVIESLYDDTPQVRRMDATKHNIWERNLFIMTRASGNAWDYNAIQFAGQQGIVRFNLFYDNLGGGLGIQVYEDEAVNNYLNRVYHNTMFANRCFGLWASGDTVSTYYGNVIANNLLFGNLDCDGSGAADIVVDNTEANTLVNNRTDDPLFTDAAARDLTLAPGSPMIDAGVFLTTTASAGSGTTMPVADAGWFYDGYGVAAAGDAIQLEGAAENAFVVAVDYETNTLTLDRPLSWSAGQGVSLKYNGGAPDVGALESP